MSVSGRGPAEIREGRVLCALLYGCTHARAAEIGRCSIQHIHKLSTTTAFRERLRQAREQLVDRVAAQVLRDAGEIVQRVKAILYDHEASNRDRLQAATILLDRMLAILPPSSAREAREQSRPVTIQAQDVVLDLSKVPNHLLRRLYEAAKRDGKTLRILPPETATPQAPTSPPEEGTPPGVGWDETRPTNPIMPRPQFPQNPPSHGTHDDQLIS